jgi:hypothetical protein
MKNLIIEYETETGKTFQCEMKSTYEIEDCEKGKFVHLFLKNDEEYQGYFQGMDDDDIMLKSLKSPNVIGLKMDWVRNYMEEK